MSEMPGRPAGRAAAWRSVKLLMQIGNDQNNYSSSVEDDGPVWGKCKKLIDDRRSSLQLSRYVISSATSRIHGAIYLLSIVSRIDVRLTVSAIRTAPIVEAESPSCVVPGTLVISMG